MKTLFCRFAALACCIAPLAAHAVDGVILITQARALSGGVTAGDMPGFPVTISEPGSYRLGSNLTVAGANADGIVITADDVTLDLNGFRIQGPGAGATTGRGITYASDGGHSVRVTNGMVRDMGGRGIELDARSTVDHVSALVNGGDGVFVTTGARVFNVESNDNGGNGIHILIGQVHSINATANVGNGVRIEYGASLLTDSVVERNTGFALSAGAVTPDRTSGYARNNFSANNGGGVQVDGSAVELGPNVCGGSLTCP